MYSFQTYTIFRGNKIGRWSKTLDSFSTPYHIYNGEGERREVISHDSIREKKKSLEAVEARLEEMALKKNRLE